MVISSNQSREYKIKLRIEFNYSMYNGDTAWVNDCELCRTEKEALGPQIHFTM